MKILLAGPILTDGVRAATGLTFPDAPPGQAQTPLVPLAAELRRRGHEVHILTLDPEVSSVETHEEGGLRLTFCPLRAPPQYRTRVRALDLFKKEISHLVEIMASSEADIVHAHWTYEYAEAAVRVEKPHLVTMHDLGWGYFFQFRDAYRFVRLLMKYRVMPRIKSLTVVAPFMVPKTRQYFFRGKVRVVPNGIQVPPFDAEQPRQKAVSPVKVATIGNNGQVKNVWRSVEAFRLIRSQIPDAELHLFGPGLDQAYTQGEPGVVGHGNTVHAELMKFLEFEATLLVHPALLEACPVIIEEAKSRGLPVVGGLASGGVPFVCGDNAGCALVDVKNPKKIADAALAFLTDQDLYNRSAILAREDAAARFDNGEISQQYEQIYFSIVEKGRL